MQTITWPSDLHNIVRNIKKIGVQDGLQNNENITKVEEQAITAVFNKPVVQSMVRPTTMWT